MSRLVTTDGRRAVRPVWALPAVAAALLAVSQAGAQPWGGPVPPGNRLVAFRLPAGGAAAAGKRGLHIPRARQTGLPVNINDSAGYSWDVYSGLRINRGTNYVYSGGLRLQISGSSVSGNVWMGPTGDELEMGPWSRGSYQVYRRCKIFRKQAMARWLDIFVNPGPAPQTIPVRIYSCFNNMSSIAHTTSGGASFAAKDWAFITDQQQGRPKLLHIVCGPKGPIRPTVRINSNQLYVEYSVTVPPKSTAVLCYFESQGHGVVELKARLKAFRLSEMLKDLSPSVRKLIVNFRAGEDLGVELERRGTDDAVQLAEGDWIMGRIRNQGFKLTTLHGELDLPAKKVVGFVGVPGRAGAVRAVLTGGQVVSASLGEGAVQIDLPAGGTLKIPYGRIRQCSYGISDARPEDMQPAEAMIVLRNGDRLAFDPAQLRCVFRTRHGTVPVKAGELLHIKLDRPDHGVHQAVFLNGSRLAGVLGPDRIELPLKLGPTLKVSRGMVKTIRFAREAREDDTLARLALSNGDLLLGRLADATYRVRTDFGEVTIQAANVRTMVFAPHDGRQIRVTLWNDTSLRGRLGQETLRFAVTPGPVLQLHPEQIAAVVCPAALPPDHIVKQVEQHVARLGAASFDEREKAQKQLERMGKQIVPLLKKHLKSEDPEIRQRVREVLKELGAAPSAASAAPGAPAVWPHVRLAWR